jgi:hypothetical protein
MADAQDLKPPGLFAEANNGKSIVPATTKKF